jgi:hypothetical protein
VHGYPARAQNGSGAWEQDGRWRLEEEEWLAGCCAGELFDVVAVWRLGMMGRGGEERVVTRSFFLCT